MNNDTPQHIAHNGVDAKTNRRQRHFLYSHCWLMSRKNTDNRTIAHKIGFLLTCHMAKTAHQINRKTFCWKYAILAKMAQTLVFQRVAQFRAHRSFSCTSKVFVSRCQTNTFASQEWHYWLAKLTLQQCKTNTSATPPQKNTATNAISQLRKRNLAPTPLSISRFFAALFASPKSDTMSTPRNKTRHSAAAKPHDPTSDTSRHERHKKQTRKTRNGK